MGKQHQVTAIIEDKRGRTIATGKNHYHKTHPVQKRYANMVGLEHKEFLHAEIHAILKAKIMGGLMHKIRIFRFNSDGTPALAKPCPICELAIRDSGIKIIEHS